MGCAIVQDSTVLLRNFLPPSLSIFPAEILAISDTSILDSIWLFRGRGRIYLLSAIRALSTPFSFVKHVLVKKVLGLIHQQLSVDLAWTPGQKGIIGNEYADMTTKEVTNWLPARSECHSTRRLVHSLCDIIQQHWTQTRTVISTTNKLCTFKSRPMFWQPSPSTSYTTEAAPRRLHVGHTALTHLFLRQPQPLCSFCGVALVVLHVLIDYRGLAAHRITCHLAKNFPHNLTPDSGTVLTKFLKHISHPKLRLCLRLMLQFVALVSNSFYIGSISNVIGTLQKIHKNTFGLTLFIGNILKTHR